MSIALHGNLRDFGIAEVFQLIGQQGKTGVLQVRGAGGEVELRFDGGCVVSAAPVGAYEDHALGEMAARCGLLPPERLPELERLRAAAGDRLERHLLDAGVPRETLRELEELLTRETLFDLLRWDDGSFRFLARPVAHDRPADSLLGAEQVLMDGLRMVDEWRVLAPALPDEAVVFRRRAGVEELRRSLLHEGAPDAAERERIYQLVDGRSPVRRVIDLSRLGRFSGMRSLSELVRGGWIEPVHEAPEAARAVGAGRARPGALRARAARVGPFLLLAGLAALALARGAPAPAPGAPLPEGALAAARSRYEAARVRHLALAERVVRGRWPESLEALPAWPAGPGRALAGAEAGAYHLARRADGAHDPPNLAARDAFDGPGSLIVLAPER